MDSDSSVSLSSLTETLRPTQPLIRRKFFCQKSRRERNLTFRFSQADRSRQRGADGMLLAFPCFLTETVDLAVGTEVTHMLGALDRGILRFWGVVTPVLRLWVGHSTLLLWNDTNFSCLGGSPNRQCSGTRTGHTAITSKRWLAFTGVSFS